MSSSRFWTSANVATVFLEPLREALIDLAADLVEPLVGRLRQRVHPLAQVFGVAVQSLRELALAAIDRVLQGRLQRLVGVGVSLLQLLLQLAEAEELGFLQIVDSFLVVLFGVGQLPNQCLLGSSLLHSQVLIEPANDVLRRAAAFRRVAVPAHRRACLARPCVYRAWRERFR